MNVFFKKYQNLVREPVEQMQFERFKKHTRANKFQIELQKSYDYFVIIYMKKLPAWLCLEALDTSRLQHLIGSYIFLLFIDQSQFSIL